MKDKTLERLRELYHEYELPEQMKTFHFSTNSELSYFLKDTKYCHDLFNYHYEYTKKEIYIKSFLTEKFYEDLKNLDNDILKLKHVVKTPMGNFSHICKSLKSFKKKKYNKFYLKSLKIYLLEKSKR